MALDIVAGTPGLWRDPAWAAGMPGVYALVAGISAYPHLEDGAAPAPDAFGLGQLGASANTAASLFDWLRQGFLHEGLPVVWCQLLLAPTVGEQAAFQARGLTHYATPDNNGLRNAIQRWTGQVPGAPAAARKSRTLFFFSGHGVQSNWRALLLPSDYLDPGFGAPQLQNCISTRELQDWMEQCPVAEHLALIDACRNEFSPLASRGATANACFPVLPASSQVPRASASLAATSPGKQAFQVPGQPLTLFGQAVLEALRGIGGNDARLEFRELVDYVKPRVNVLLQQAGGNPMDQTVRPRIEGDDAFVVTELPPAARGTARAASRGDASDASDALDVETDTDTDTVSGAGARTGAEFDVPARPRGARTPAPRRQAKAPAALPDRRFDAALAVHQPIGLAALQQNFDENHRRMGHEYVAHLWRDGVSAWALLGGNRLPDALTVRAVARDEPSSMVQVDLELAPLRGGLLLVFEGEHQVHRERLAVALPTDEHGPVPIRLSMHFGRADPFTWPRLLKLEARLGPATDSTHYKTLWALARAMDQGRPPETGRAAAKLLQAAAATATTATAAAMLLLARAGRVADLQDRARDLMQACEWLPDTAVLWAETLRYALAHGVPKPFGLANPQVAMADSLASLRQHGLPFFVESLELAERLLRQAQRGPLDAARREALQQVQQAIARLQEVAQPDGHFPVLAGLPRPAAMPGEGALTVPEMRALLGRPAPRPAGSTELDSQCAT